MVVKWVNRQAPLYGDPKLRSRICDIAPKTLVNTTGMTNGLYEEVIHITAAKLVTGWVHTDDLEDYVRNFATNVVKIEDQTPDLNDFEQYTIYKSVKQTNQCGELCVADVLGISLGTLLKKWEADSPNFFKRVFGTGKARGTGADELIEMFDLFGRKAVNLNTALFQPHIGRARYTVKGLNGLLNRGAVIMSVHIDGNTGLIKNSGILHWIGLKTVLSERNGQGFTTYYNPAMNCIESSSWEELMASAGPAPYGVHIPNIDDESLWTENRH